MAQSATARVPEQPSHEPAPLALTDSQVTAIMQLARPLEPQQRITFFEMVAASLNGRSEIGDGELHRLCRELQARYFAGVTMHAESHRVVRRNASA